MATSTFTQLLNSELVLTPVYTINPSTCPKVPGGRISQCVNEMGKKSGLSCRTVQCREGGEKNKALRMKAEKVPTDPEK